MVYRTVDGIPGQRLYPDKIRSKTMTFLDAFVMESLQSQTNNIQLLQLFDKMLEQDVYELYWEDVKYYAHWLHNMSFPYSKLQIRHECPECKNVFTTGISLNDIQYDELPSDITKDVSTIKTENGKILNIKIPKVKDMLIVELLGESPNLALKDIVFSVKTSKQDWLSDLFYALNGESTTELKLDKETANDFLTTIIQERYTQITNDLTASDYALIKDVLHKRMHFGCYSFIIKQCPHCLKEVKLELFSDNLITFLSKIQLGQPDGNQICLNSSTWDRHNVIGPIGDEPSPMVATEVSERTARVETTKAEKKFKDKLRIQING